MILYVRINYFTFKQIDPNMFGGLNPKPLTKAIEWSASVMHSIECPASSFFLVFLYLSVFERCYACVHMHCCNLPFVSVMV